MKKRILIVGGVAGGASTAARLRRLDENAEIIMFEKGNYISFANCGLPYYIGEKIKERSKLIVQTPEAMTSRFNLDIRINSEVTSVDSKNNMVKVTDNTGRVYEESYDYLVLSPGAKAIKPGISGINSSRIMTVRNIPDTDKVKAAVDSATVKRAVVIGGGFIGIEMAENLKEKGISVTLIEAAPHILAPFDSEMSVIAEKEMNDNGVNLLLNDGVERFEDSAKETIVTLKSGTTVAADLIILAIGVSPDTAFLKDSGIKLGERGHIIVDKHMKTNVDNIYALGDATLVTDFVSGNPAAVALAGPANKQGRIVADNICSITSSFVGAQATAILKVFDLTAASTGSNERTLKRLNIPYKAIYVHPVSHASYYPNALPLSLKLLFDADGKILGAQAIGYDGVDKRIDVIASVMRLNGTIYDLTELELSYAPPFSSAKDPVNMAGFTAENVLKGLTDIITPTELLALDMSKVTLLDVRTALEFDNGHLEGALNLPVDELRDNYSKLDKNMEIIVYCQVGIRGYIAERILKAKGFKVRNLTGGYKTMSTINFKPKNNFDNLDEVAAEGISSKSGEKKNEFDKTLDACGLCCPGPLMQVKACIDTMEEGEILKVQATDPGFYSDINAWCSKTNNCLLSLEKSGANIVALIEKSSQSKATSYEGAAPIKDNKTMVVFSGDLDKAIASFIIANGAASMGKKVTMFFTFWGLNILRRSEPVNVQKNFIGKMFGLMMPRGSQKLKLSKMNMLGMGPKMIRAVMKNNNVSSLEDLIKAAIASGVEIVACQMSMDVMGIKKEELIPGVKIGGVGYYLGEAEDSNVNLFI